MMMIKAAFLKNRKLFFFLDFLDRLKFSNKIERVHFHYSTMTSRAVGKISSKCQECTGLSTIRVLKNKLLQKIETLS